MGNRVSRTDLLQALEAVQPGLSSTDVLEQSASFVFRKGKVITYNEEVYCRAKSPLPPAVLGAVPAAPLLAVLQKIPDDELDVSTAEGELRLAGKRRRSGVRMAEPQLDLSAVDRPDGWRPLPDRFTDAVQLVQECAGRDVSQFLLTCVHVHPDYLEACDNDQFTRYLLKTGAAAPFLLRRDSVKHICKLDMTEVAETEGWVHFRNPDGLVLGCRRYAEDYPDLSGFLEFHGERMTLPRDLDKAAELAAVFSAENKEDDAVLVRLRDGWLQVKGVGASGWASDTKKVRYHGPVLEFRVGPAMLAQIANKHNDCEIGAGCLRIEGGKWTYLASLAAPEANGQPQEKADA
jgi:hypothetical protein